MITCSKTYNDIPFAHRQHHHQGHCRFIHGHNWAITLTFACRETDENGFVIDFGGLKFIKQWLGKNLDHACVLNEDDPQRDHLLSQLDGMIKPLIVENCSSEGLARHFHAVFDEMVRDQTEGRVWIQGIEVREDSRNASQYTP